VLRALKRVPDRWLDPLWRALALRALRRHPTPRSVLFVCHGSICRSPFAEVVLRRALEATDRTHIRVASAGFVGPGRSCPDHAVEVAASRGLDLSSHRSQLPTPTVVRAADLIVVMEGGQRGAFRALFGRDALVLGDLDLQPIETRTIEDPFDQDRAVFARSYARIERCVGQLVATVRWPAAPDRGAGNAGPSRRATPA
jgi:protein-tyrosine phosphatase